MEIEDLDVESFEGEEEEEEEEEDDGEYAENIDETISLKKTDQKTEKEEEKVEEEIEPENEVKCPRNYVGSVLTNDKIQEVIYCWLISLQLAILLNWIGMFCCWKMLFFSLGSASSIAVLFMATTKICHTGRAVLITGCDTGFGHALALHLDKLGFTVIACCLSSKCEGAESLKTEGSENLHVLQMDVCNENDVSKARKEVDSIIKKEDGLWGLVNNAGISTFGELEWVSVNTYRKICEVNLLGMVSVTKAFLPLVRKAKGRVVNVSSMLGRMGGPMRSPYVMTKYGVEGFSECLRHEMKPWGVDVIVMEPGNYIAGTAIFTEESVDKMSKDMWSMMTDEVKEDYTEEFFNTKINTMKTYIGGGESNITPVIVSFTESLTQKYPQARYQPVQWSHKLRIFVATHLPEWVFDNIYVGAMHK